MALKYWYEILQPQLRGLLHADVPAFPLQDGVPEVPAVYSSAEVKYGFHSSSSKDSSTVKVNIAC